MIVQTRLRGENYSKQSDELRLDFFLLFRIFVIFTSPGSESLQFENMKRIKRIFSEKKRAIYLSLFKTCMHMIESL